MLYFVAEDHYYYQKEQIDKLKKQYQKDKIIVYPNEQDIKDAIAAGEVNTTAFISPVPPFVLSDKLKYNTFFSTITLKNVYYPFTKEQIDLGIDQNKILSEKLGINITEPTVTFKDYGGTASKILIDEAKKIELRFLFNLKPKGFFIVGIPGTGKTFFAKCFAGETNRKLVEFNISKIKEAHNPIEKIEMILTYFKQTPGKYLIWIDEIEKQFSTDDTTDILGVFLTELNEFQSGVSNVFFVATANNIDRISTKYPELLRPGGRFDKLISLLPSEEADTRSIFEIYINEKKEHFVNEFFVTAFLQALNSRIAQGIKNTRLEKIAHYIKEIAQPSVLEHLKYKIGFLFSLYLNDKQDKTKYHINEEYKKIQELYSKQVLTQEELYRKIVYFLKKYIVQMQQSKDKILIESIVGKVKEKYSFHFPIEETIMEAYKLYREQVSIKSRFPYTPAEILNIINVAYTNYYLSEINREKTIFEIVTDVLIDNIPIQKQFIEGIEQMAAQTENFFTV